MLEAIPPNTEANITPLLGLLSVSKLGSIRPISFFKNVHMLCYCNMLFVFYKILHMVTIFLQYFSTLLK